MILRPSSTVSGGFEIVGWCFIWGLADGEGLLGPVQRPWKAMAHLNEHTIIEPMYLNTDKNTKTQEDPRLIELPKQWERIDLERTPDDPLLFAPHQNKLTGEVINSDPRLLPEELRERGVKLEEFRLV